LRIGKKENVRVRQPLTKILLPSITPGFFGQVGKVADLIKSEVNVKRIEFLHESAEFFKQKIKPNFKTLGRKLGKDMKAAAQIINVLGHDDIMNIKKTGQYSLEIGDSQYILTAEDFEISVDDIPGWQVATDREITVALDITLTDELKKEGIARELINRIQNIRKSSDFEVTDRIKVQISSNEQVSSSLAQFKDYVATEVLADEINVVADVSGESIDINDDISVIIGVAKS